MPAPRPRRPHALLRRLPRRAGLVVFWLRQGRRGRGHARAARLGDRQRRDRGRRGPHGIRPRDTAEAGGVVPQAGPAGTGQGGDRQDAPRDRPAEDLPLLVRPRVAGDQGARRNARKRRRSCGRGPGTSPGSSPRTSSAGGADERDAQAPGSPGRSEADVRGERPRGLFRPRPKGGGGWGLVQTNTFSHCGASKTSWRIPATAPSG